MPAEEMWQTFFNPTETLQLLGLKRDTQQAVDLGCGYGTFTVPAARLIQGVVHGFDIEPEMIAETERRAERQSLGNITLHLRDFAEEGTGLPDSAVDYVMLFNILHAEHPLELLRESHRMLANGGRLGIMHWNHDSDTPRGPSMDIRPRPEDCAQWARGVGFTILSSHVDLPPYHYGIIAEKD